MNSANCKSCANADVIEITQTAMEGINCIFISNSFRVSHRRITAAVTAPPKSYDFKSRVIGDFDSLLGSVAIDRSYVFDPGMTSVECAV